MTTPPLLPVTHQLLWAAASGWTTVNIRHVSRQHRQPRSALPARRHRPCPGACPAPVNGCLSRVPGRASPPQLSPLEAPARRGRDPTVLRWRNPLRRGGGKLRPHRPAVDSPGSPGLGASAGGSVVLPAGSAEAEAARSRPALPGHPGAVPVRGATTRAGWPAVTEFLRPFSCRGLSGKLQLSPLPEALTEPGQLKPPASALRAPRAGGDLHADLSLVAATARQA